MYQKFIITASAAIIAAAAFARQARAATLPECVPPPQVITCEDSCPGDLASYCEALNPNPEFCVYSDDMSGCVDGCSTKHPEGTQVTCTYVRGPA